MKIPRDAGERAMLYDQVTNACLRSRRKRFELYQQCRAYALFGSGAGNSAAYNKIGATLETLTSFIYSSDAVRFNLFVGDTAPQSDIFKATPLARELEQQWRMTKTHILFGQAVLWALVYGCTLTKTIWHAGLARNYLVEPHNFGVYREDVMELDDQEAFAMCFTITKSQLAMELEGNPRRESILERAAPGASQDRLAFSDGMTRLMTPFANPIMNVPGSIAPQAGSAGSYPIGGLPGGYAQYDYTPDVGDTLIDMVDLYIWNDDISDYQIVTRAAGGVTVYDRAQSFVGVKGVPHFTVIRADDTLYDYFFGKSFVADLTTLQDWRTDGVAGIRLLESKQADPPTSVTGMGAMAQEKLQALRAAGGMAAFDMPGAKVEVHAPKMPENVFSSLDQLDRMFDDTAGIGHILQGKGESGVRSKGQADLMARLGSARPKKRAIVVEECAGELGTLMLRSMQTHSDQRFQTEPLAGAEPLTFIAQQFTTDFEARVDAHSTSPIFVEDAHAHAKEMLELHVIDRETYLDMVRPPNVQALKERLKVIEAKEAKAAEMKAQAEATKGGGAKH